MALANVEGATLGRYELIRRLATGGMAEIFLARAGGIAGFQKLIAVKQMLPHLARDPAFVEMFLAEARIAARLDHPNIVRVDDIGEDDGNYYYTMEYVRGADLLRLMKRRARRRGAIPIDCAAAIGIGLCAALDFAHELTDPDGNSLRIVHRDVSLSNVLVSCEGAIKLGDFGVAKSEDRGRRTPARVVKGKVAYMSPEQCRGEPLDGRSDIFAIGIVLHEITTGTRLFGAAETDFHIMEKIVRGEVPRPSQLCAGYPAVLEEIIVRALQRAPDDRYQTARDMRRDLEAFVHAEWLAPSATALGQLIAEAFPEAVQRARATRATKPMRARAGAVSDDDDAIVEPAPSSSPPMRSTVTMRATRPGAATQADRAAESLVGRAVRASRARAVAEPTPVPRRPAMARGGELLAEPAAASSLPPNPAVLDNACSQALVSIPRTSSTDLAAPAVARTLSETRPADDSPATSFADGSGWVPPTRLHGLPARRRWRSPAVISAAAGAGIAITGWLVFGTARAPGGSPATATSGEDTRAPSQPRERTAPQQIASAHPTDLPHNSARGRPAPGAASASRTLDAHPSIASLEVTHQIPTAGAGVGVVVSVRHAIERALPALRACYQASARSAGAAPVADLRVEFTVDPGMAIHDVHAMSAVGPLPDARATGFDSLSTCATTAITQLQIAPEPPARGARVVVMIALRPD